MAALGTVKGIDDAEDRTDALVSIAAAQVKAGDHGAAGETLATALETAKGIDDAWSRTDALANIARGAGRGRRPRRGRRNLGYPRWKRPRGIDYARLRTDALVSIAAAQVKTGDHSAAGETLIAALETAKGIDDARNRAKALATIAAVLTAAESRRR